LSHAHRLEIGALALLAVFAWPDGTKAGTECRDPDPSFQQFLARFKSDGDFQLSRMMIPLRYTEREPDNSSTTKLLSLTELRVRRSGLVRDLAVNTGDSETDACEDKPKIGRGVATLVQYSCHSDLFSSTYQFVKKRGCWLLNQVTSSGG
jgi:hypothetical protein